MKEMKKLNLRQPNDVSLVISPGDVPTLVPTEKLSQWMEGDTDPYYKVQKIEYPTQANGYTYTESFWESFIAKLNERPTPGSKGGHETSWGKRAPTDLLLVGGKIEKGEDGAGSVYLKNYIPPAGESGDNSVFIKENKTGMVDYSLVSYTRDVREETPDGVRWLVVESMYGERNDAVEYATGAMEQKTNSREAGNIGEENVKKEEILTGLKNLKLNADITLPEIAKMLGLEALLITDEQKANLSAFGKVKALCGDVNPEEFVSGLLEEKKTNAVAVREAMFNEAFGPKKNEKNGKVNHSRAFAETLVGSDELTEEKINEVKENETFKKLKADMADYRAEYNQVETPAEPASEDVVFEV